MVPSSEEAPFAAVLVVAVDESAMVGVKSA